MSSPCLETFNIINLPSLALLRQVLNSNDLFFLLVCPDVDLLVPSHCDHMRHLLIIVRLKGACHACDLFVDMVAVFVKKQLSQALAVTEVPHSSGPVACCCNEAPLCRIETARSDLGFLKGMIESLLTPCASPNLDMSLPVSMSHTAMKLPSSPETTASNSVL